MRHAIYLTALVFSANLATAVTSDAATLVSLPPLGRLIDPDSDVLAQHLLPIQYTPESTTVDLAIEFHHDKKLRVVEHDYYFHYYPRDVLYVGISLHGEGIRAALHDESLTRAFDEVASIVGPSGSILASSVNTAYAHPESEPNYFGLEWRFRFHEELIIKGLVWHLTLDPILGRQLPAELSITPHLGANRMFVIPEPSGSTIPLLSSLAGCILLHRQLARRLEDSSVYR